MCFIGVLDAGLARTIDVALAFDLLVWHAHAFASVEPINRRDVIYSIVAKIGRGFQCLIFAIEGPRWMGFVVSVFEDHNISPLLSGLAHNDLAGFVDVCVFS